MLKKKEVNNKDGTVQKGKRRAVITAAVTGLLVLAQTSTVPLAGTLTTGIYIREFSYRSDVAFILMNPMSLDIGGCQQITKAIIILLFFSFLPVLGHCVIGIYLMEQEDLKENYFSFNCCFTCATMMVR